jgi:ketopantoate reductase
MAQTLEIVKKVRLTTKQRLTLVSMANGGGSIERLDWGVQHDLLYLGLVEKFKIVDREAIRKKVAVAWVTLGKACRLKDAGAAEKAVDVIRREGWESEREGCRLTAAASEYLTKGRVLVTVGKGALPVSVGIAKAG